MTSNILSYLHFLLIFLLLPLLCFPLTNFPSSTLLPLLPLQYQQAKAIRCSLSTSPNLLLLLLHPPHHYIFHTSPFNPHFIPFSSLLPPCSSKFLLPSPTSTSHTLTPLPNISLTSPACQSLPHFHLSTSPPLLPLPF